MRSATFVAIGLSATLLSGACSSDDDEPCLSTREFFVQKAWGPVLSEVCLKCHSTDGIAVDQGAGLELFPPEYPTFLDANLDSLRRLANTLVDGRPLLLRKPAGELEHGGGVQLAPGSDGYQVLQELVERFGAAEECPEEPGVATFDDVTLLDAPATLRKAALHLVGRLPTDAELASVLAKGDDALATAVDGMLEEDAFHVRLKELFNDHLLTDYYYFAYTGAGVNVLSEDDFPNAGEAYFDALEGDDRYYANAAVAREPLELISHIVRNDRPFTEVLTADYTVVNQYSAKIFNADATDFSDGYEWQEAKIQVSREGKLVELPHAGVLTSPMFLNRYPTTPTNRNRHRAWKILDLFLATDILAVAARPLNVGDTTQYDNPTRDDATCVTCHKRIDPIAGAFRNWNDNDQEQFEPDREWHKEMFPPGFGSEVMTVADYGSSLNWLGQRIVQDPRFPRAMVHIMWQAVLGAEPSLYPRELGSADGVNRLNAWKAEDETLRTLDRVFVESDYNLKHVARALVLSPYFRAKGAAAGVSGGRTTELSGVGTGRLLTPEMLNRKIAAVVGVPWSREYDGVGFLEADFRILYGGIDSLNAAQRLTDPNGIMTAVGWRMANEMSCKVTAYEFWRPQAERVLFPHVTMAHVPDAETGDPIPGSIDAIRKNIQHLHSRILGETLALDHPEIDRTYQLFYDTWKEGRAGLVDASIETNMDYQCWARIDWATGEALSDEERLFADPDYTIRAWRAVTAYLLSDYEFLYE